MNYFELLRLVVPETIVVLTALIVLAADLLVLRELDWAFRRRIGVMMAGVGCLGAIGWMVALPEQARLWDGLFVVDPLVQLLQVSLLILTLFTLLLSLDAKFTVHFGEYVALVLLATVGLMFLVSSEDVLMIFVSLELTSLSLYILTAFNKHSRMSAEAGLKYFLFGGMAAAFTLFGLSLLYGLAGGTNLSQIAAAIHGPKLDTLLLLGLTMTVIGFAFKVAAAPFHLWAPDVYQGAPSPSAALIASGSKVAGFFVFAKVMLLGFHGAEGSAAWRLLIPGWVPLLAVLAVVSMVLGNLAAIVQSSVRRLLAYSAIAHAGYVLLAVISRNERGLAALVYYVITYGLTTLGAFGVVAAVQDAGGGERLPDFAGLSRRAPLLAFCLMIFLLSLAGIPPLAGFFGKFYVFTSALSAPTPALGLLWLVVLAIAMSAVSLYYYLQVLKQVFVAAPVREAALRTPVLGQVALVILALAVIVLGCAPEWLLGRLGTAIAAAGL